MHANTHAHGLATLESLAEARHMMRDQQAEEAKAKGSGVPAAVSVPENGNGIQSGSEQAGTVQQPQATFGDVPDFATVVKMINENRGGEVPMKQIPEGVNVSDRIFHLVVF